MKKIAIILTILSSVGACLEARDVGEKNHYRKKKCCEAPIIITADEINKATRVSPLGLILDKPASYKLCEDVNWNATNDGNVAITIASGFVTLDLDDHIITQFDTSLANNIAIQVQPNTEFVTINNGTLQQFSLAGIFVKDGSSCISIDNIKINQSCYNGSMSLPFPPLGDIPAAGGIVIGGNPNNFARDIAVTNISCCNNGILDGNFSPGVNLAAILSSYTNEITVKNLRVDNFYGNNFSSAGVFSFGSGLLVSGLTASNLSGNREVVGVSLNVFDNSIVEDLQITNIVLLNDTNAPQTNNPAGAEGAKYTSAENFILRKASFEDLQVVSTVPVDHTVFSMTCNGLSLGSFETPCKNGLIQDVSTVGVHSDGALLESNNVRACGYSNDGVDSVTYERCYVSDVRIPIGYAFGFGSKLVSNNPLRNPRVSFINCVAQDVEVTGSANYAAGFVLSADQEEVINCTANRIVDKRDNPQAYGVILDAFATGEARNCIVRNNTLTNCSTYAIFDNTSVQENIITGNYAAFNGPAGEGPGYSVNTNAPIVGWKYNADPAPVTKSSLDNIDIQNS